MTLSALFRYPERPVAAGEHDLERFDAEMSALDLQTQQSLYTSTFDLAPSCTPYLGVHLFGDENADRARLMVGLRLAYKRAGMSEGGELPDHIAEVLDFDARGVEEKEELRRLILVPALTKMNELLQPTSNPYRHLVAATLHRMEESRES